MLSKWKKQFQINKNLSHNKKKILKRLWLIKKMNELVGNLKKDLEDLDKRFNKKNRDFGKLALEKTGAIERIINKGSDALATDV